MPFSSIHEHIIRENPQISFSCEDCFLNPRFWWGFTEFFATFSGRFGQLVGVMHAAIVNPTVSLLHGFLPVCYGFLRWCVACCILCILRGNKSFYGHRVSPVPVNRSSYDMMLMDLKCTDFLVDILSRYIIYFSKYLIGILYF